jgi:hypothetical protein
MGWVEPIEIMSDGVSTMWASKLHPDFCCLLAG